MKVTKTLKALVSVFVCIYVLFVFEVIYLNREETVENYKSKSEEYQVCAVEAPDETTVTFFGDMMFDRFVWHTFKDAGLKSIFSDLDLDRFSDSDIVFANLEGPVSEEPISDVWIDDSLIFNMPTETIDALKHLGIDGVSLANNHTLNAGQSGFTTTKGILKDNGIKYGGYQNDFNEGSVIRFDEEIPISIITVNFVGYNYQSKVLETIEQEALNNRFVVVFPHWGAEYSQTHNYLQEDLAHAWVDAGADLVAGSHPHVVQDVEIYQDVPIFYSLGNFVFDQLFSSETQKGLAVKILIGEKYQRLEIMPFTSTSMKPKFDEEVDLSYYVGEEYIISNKIELKKDWRK